MLHIGATASPTIRSCLKPSSRARRANFWLSLADETQKGESEQPCPGMSSCMEYQLGPACALEGLFEALPRFLSRRLVPGRCRERAHFLQINKKTGNRLRQQLVDAVTGEPVRPIRP